jgi:hypothetical protein
MGDKMMQRHRAISEQLGRCAADKKIGILVNWLKTANDKDNILLAAIDSAGSGQEYEAASRNLRDAINKQHETLISNLTKYFVGREREEFIKIVPSEQHKAIMDGEHLWHQTLTKGELRTRGEAIYGRNWQLELSRATNTPKTTIQKWAMGLNPVPKWVAPRLAILEAIEAHKNNL